MLVHVRLRDGEANLGVSWDVTDHGIFVKAVEEGSPGAMAGIVPTWALLDIDGRAMTSIADLTTGIEAVYRHEGGCLRMAPTYTPAQVTSHNTLDDCWIVVNHSVYNITPFVNQHPGGTRILQQYAGRVATTSFNKIHSKKAKTMLNRYLIGYVRLVGPDVHVEDKLEKEEHQKSPRSPTLDLRREEGE
eukprot:TRINITY_DN16971_c0_g1_i1.p1 TRINITY_DN16971_c0_g1~~TRINITY_DN16971_c0_g1_i1.p1  ORF type:complete len:189 (+),score=40.23 TRINITY_DN16971_c0_g1_i1:234-800(+)